MRSGVIFSYNWTFRNQWSHHLLAIRKNASLRALPHWRDFSDLEAPTTYYTVYGQVSSLTKQITSELEVFQECWPLYRMTSEHFHSCVHSEVFFFDIPETSSSQYIGIIIKMPLHSQMCSAFLFFFFFPLLWYLTITAQKYEKVVFTWICPRVSVYLAPKSKLNLCLHEIVLRHHN